MKGHQKKFWIILLGITVLALAVRVLAAWQMYDSVSGVQQPISATDMDTYIKYGKQFKDGTYTDFDGAYYYQPFYSAVFLRGVFTLFDDSIFALVMIQAVIGALTVLLTGLIGSLVGGRKVGVGAAVILALFRNHILYTPFALIAVLQTFLIALTMYLLILGFKKGHNRFWILAGLTTACSILCRGNFLLIIPLIILMIAWKYRSEKKQAFIKCTLFILMVYLPQMPFSIKNYQIEGKWTGPSIAGGVVLAYGNNPDGAPGTMDMEASHFFAYDSGDEVNQWQKTKLETSLKSSIKNYQIEGKWTGPSIAGGVVLGIGNNPDGAPGTMDMEASHYLHFDGGDEYSHWSAIKSEVPIKSSMKSWIMDYPLQWLDLKLQVLLLYFSNEECYNNISLHQAARQVPWLYSPVLIDYWLVGIPFIVFLLYYLFNFRKSGKTLLSWVSLVYIGSTVLFYVLSRYKLPIIPLMSVIAAYEFRRWYLLLKENDSRKKTFLAVSFLIAVFTVVRSFSFYQENIEAAVNRMARSEGNQFQTEKSRHVKDHNNSLRGGWINYMLKPNETITKNFAVSESFEGGKGVIRLYAAVDAKQPSPTVVVVEHAGKTYRKRLMFHSRWIEVDVEEVNPQKDFKIRLASNVPAAIFYTPQRDFGRSLINDRLLDGEWIIQLKVFKEK
ncbi:MAG: glycosyltransferase family 39 protein [Lentisphaerales bacterium]|nr:glycosyltransferase family 39 protein [Lentisphaerales bacterium]